MSDQFTVGEIVTIVIPAPGVGNNWSYTVPAGIRLKVRSIAFYFAADATVISRKPIITVTDPEGGISYAEISSASIAANTSVNITFAPGSLSVTASNGSIITVGLSSELMLVPGEVLSSQIKNLQAGDEATEVYLLVESFLLP